MTFTNSNWNIPQTVTLTAVGDADADNESVTITHVIDSGATMDASYAALMGLASVRVMLSDRDAPGVTLNQTMLSLTEGDSATYMVELISQPTGDVVLEVESGDTSAVTLDTDPAMTGAQNTLTFTNSNWNAAQTVTLTAVGDADADDESVTISHAVDMAATMDASYDALAGLASVRVMLDDDDMRGITLDPTTMLTPDEGDTATYTVVLTSQPMGNVVLEVESSDTSALTLDTNTAMTGAQNTLTFTNSNWNTAQTVTLTAVGDADADDESVTITHVIDMAATMDTSYDALMGLASVMVMPDDDDTRGILLSQTMLTSGRGRHSNLYSSAHQPAHG